MAGAPVIVRQPGGVRRPTSTAVWQIASAIEDGAGSVHPTMKPIECFRRPISYHTLPGEIIYEPFAGSGTALIAAEMSGPHLLRDRDLAGLLRRHLRALPSADWHRGGASWLRHLGPR